MFHGKISLIAFFFLLQYYNMVMIQSISNRLNNCGASLRFHWHLNRESTAICFRLWGFFFLLSLTHSFEPKITKSWLMTRIFLDDVSALKVILKCKSRKSAMILLNVTLALFKFSTINLRREHSHSMTDKSIEVHYSNGIIKSTTTTTKMCREKSKIVRHECNVKEMEK